MSNLICASIDMGFIGKFFLVFLFCYIVCNILLWLIICFFSDVILSWPTPSFVDILLFPIRFIRSLRIW